MRKFIFSAVAASVMAVSSVASAGAFTATGVIESLNAKANTIRLVDGNSYQLPADVNLSGLTAGQRVNVTWDSQNPSSIDGRSSDIKIAQFKADSITLAN
ncbi:MAG: DUF1344 domain-containing protein [Phyllobacterium sp.]